MKSPFLIDKHETMPIKIFHFWFLKLYIWFPRKLWETNQSQRQLRIQPGRNDHYIEEELLLQPKSENLNTNKLLWTQVPQRKIMIQHKF